MKTESTLPLLRNEEKEARYSETIPEWKAFTKVVMMASMCFIGTMFIPINVVVNTAILGHEVDSIYLAALGLGSATTGIYGAFSWAYTQGAAQMIAQAYG